MKLPTKKELAEGVIAVIQILAIIVIGLAFAAFIVWLNTSAPCSLFRLNNIPYRCLVGLNR